MSIVADKNQELVSKIVAQEKSHIRQLQEMKEKMIKGN
jgi:rubrerythrin